MNAPWCCIYMFIAVLLRLQFLLCCVLDVCSLLRSGCWVTNVHMDVARMVEKFRIKFWLGDVITWKM